MKFTGMLISIIEPLASGFCIFHDKDYLLQDKTNYEEHKRKILDRLKHKVNHTISYNEPLLCIGFQLPDFSLSDLTISKEFTKPVYFSTANFQGKADFSNSEFYNKTYVSCHFKDKTHLIMYYLREKRKLSLT
jgi:hypothetical protein